MQSSQEKIMELVQHSPHHANLGALAEGKAMSERPGLIPGGEEFYAFVLKEMIK